LIVKFVNQLPLVLQPKYTIMNIMCPDCNVEFDGQFKHDNYLDDDVCVCPECQAIFNENHDLFAAEGDDWSEMSWDRGGGESDEDYQDRIEGLNSML